MKIIIIIVVVGIVCFLIGKKSQKKNNSQASSKLKQPEPPKTSNNQPIIRTIGGVDYDLSEVAKMLENNDYKSYMGAQKKFEEITGMRAYALDDDSQAQVEAEQIFEELNRRKKIHSRTQEILDTFEVADLSRMRELKEKERQEKLRLQKEEKNKDTKIPWFTVGVMLTKLNQTSTENKKLKRDLTKALNEIKNKK